MKLDRYFRFILAIVVGLTLQGASSAESNPRVIPFHKAVLISAQTAKEPWSIPITSSEGKTVYFLSYTPEYWVGGQLEGIDVLLRRAGAGADGANLLAPVKNWHGMQAYIFAASDLAQGRQKSAYGKERAIPIKNLGLVVRINIVNALVSPISVSEFQLDRLEMQIEIDNAVDDKGLR